MDGWFSLLGKVVRVDVGVAVVVAVAVGVSVEGTHSGLWGIHIVGETVCEYVSVGEYVEDGSVGGVSGMKEGSDLSSVCVVGVWSG